ncbi:AbrB/MazE/SpoVT family DNA-binding domain-containing protein [Geomesophilobacter sediminis]|uniref:AbrB/MazE/SpoVT family DNA-binding domain-containing protein n=1 Tax=Geomesophilobacter sediminis TaxID=2798584 RepID=A0A8J7JCS4_9BACT|nr:AbrB/MazE/SpoVT family DNA-binding domain-containing protein [Geomesophilobacter sediminis]
METRLSSKGQIVIPRRIRQNHGWEPGVAFTIVEDGDSLILRPLVAKKGVDLSEVVGCAGYRGEKKSLAEMDAGVLEEARRQAEKWSR